MASNLEIIRATYEGPSEQNGKNLIAALAPDAVWVEAAGFAYAGTSGERAGGLLFARTARRTGL